jgi:PAS domain S-box-containing protein
MHARLALLESAATLEDLERPERLERKRQGRNAQPPITRRSKAASVPRAQQPKRNQRADVERSRALVEATGQIIWTADAQGNLTGDLAPWCAFTGQTPAQASGRGWLDAIHPDDRERTQRAWEEAVTGTEPFEIEDRVRRHDGAYRVRLVRAAPVLGPDGGIREWVGTGADITERKRAEAEREELLARELAARAEAEAATERLHQLLALTDTALQHLDLESLLRHLLERVRMVLAVDNVAILLLDERHTEGAQLTLRAARGPEEDLIGRVRVAVGTGFAGRIAATRKPLIVDDLTAFAVANPMLRERLRSALGVPLIVGGRLIGVVHIGTAQPHTFTDDDVRLLERVADRLALAIDRTQVYEAAARARAEAAAQAGQLAAIFDAITDGVFVYDHAGHLVRANVAGRSLLPDAPSTVYDALLVAERRPPYAPRDEQGWPLPEEQWPLARLLRGETLTGTQTVDITVRLPDGRERFLSIGGAPVRDATELIVGGVAVVRDVTERRALEQRTAEALAALLDMAEALVATDVRESAGLDAATSAAATRAVGQRLAELTRSVLGCTRVGIVAFDDAGLQHPIAVSGLTSEQERRWWAEQTDLPVGESPDPELARRFFSGEVLRIDLTRPPFDQVPNPYGVRTMLAAPLRIGERVVGMLSLDYGGAEHDYTDQAVALAGAVAKLAALALERLRLAREHAAARQAKERLDEFLSIAGHELRTPITGIKATIQLAERQMRVLATTEAAAATDAARMATRLGRIQHQLDRADRQSDRLDRLVSDLLDVSRIQAGGLELRLERTDLAAIVFEAVEEQRLVHPGRVINCEMPKNPATPEDAEVLVRADVDRIGQVVTNFLTNALKYSDPDQPIGVHLSVDGGQEPHQARRARVAVRDLGPGLPEAEQQRIWERFHRVPGVKQQGGGVGLGLGLYISRGIVERHGGTVGVESAPGQGKPGATFWFTLPLADGLEDAGS